MDEIFMRRCIELAKCGFGTASPNPMVGAVIVCDGKIIGEGWHRKCGEAHAEVNAVNSVADKSLLKKSTIYVSLEPCAHVGRTPACADMLIREGIPNIVVGSIDPFEKVAGKGIEKLRNAGRNVKIGVLRDECDWLNRRFFTFHTKRRPYVILKWAQTADGFIDNIRNDSQTPPLKITDQHFSTLVHKWRTEEDAILVGTRTALLDNPQLTARLWSGRNPVRVCIDREMKVPDSSRIFDCQAKTIIINGNKEGTNDNLIFCKADFNENIVPQILDILYRNEIQSVIVEGGAQTLKSFISLGLWDEARVFTNSRLNIGNGVKAPEFRFECPKDEANDGITLRYFYNNDFYTRKIL
ncbi:MAG: bifunctional diaminohydroxyphosphoribosylaminopyrimidine deaminase/5-amino-6-(5-phosphoribosylamino)uracil reductase RibD [Bacteroidales bacterium]|nr:bifunctional diaminohydroxyphosphoribosylaminopyrimidine deaminase/5-amino-6-(5-phosphoribosylamino)uracil reductase RibD [Bacteroidales bacterium]